MRKACFASLLLLAAGAGLAPAQAPGNLPPAPVPVIVPAPPTLSAPELLPPPGPAPVAGPPAPPQLVPVPPPGPYGSGAPVIVPPCDHAPTVWFQTDLLLWWVKSGPLNVPLVTTGSASDAIPGAIGQPNTQVLHGGNGLNYGTFAGARFDIGAWLDAKDRFGIDAGLFLIGENTTGFRAFSDLNGLPLLAVPFVNAQTGRHDQVPVAGPDTFAGGAIVRSSSRMWGTNLDGLFNVYRGGGVQVTLVGGFEFLHLREDLNLSTPDVDISDGRNNGVVFNTFDDFKTVNDFYGGRIGARVNYRWRFVTVDLLAAVGLGGTHQSLAVDGFNSSLDAQSFTPAVGPGGIFAQPTNMGHTSGWDFTVVPQAQLKLGFDVWHNVRFILAYDFLYWSSVVRPGAQVNGVLNLSQNSLLGGGSLVGLAQPAPLFNRSDFFAQGLSLGLELRW
jgi:hypothetical protein